MLRPHRLALPPHWQSARRSNPSDLRRRLSLHFSSLPLFLSLPLSTSSRRCPQRLPSLSLSPFFPFFFFSCFPGAFASLQAWLLPLLFCSSMLHCSKHRCPLNIQSPVSQPFPCIPTFSLSHLIGFPFLFSFFFIGNVLFVPRSSWGISLLCICPPCIWPFMHFTPQRI